MGVRENVINGLKSIGDIARVYGNAATFGYADPLANFLTGTTDSEQRTAESRARLGISGDILTGVGHIVGPAAAFRGGALALQGARAAAAPVGQALGVVARSPVGAAIAAHPWQTAAGALGVPIASVMAHGERVPSTLTPAPAAPIAATAVRGTKTAGSGLAGLFAPPTLPPAVTAALAHPAAPAAAVATAAASPFDQRIQQFAAANNGRISLNELAALSEVEQRIRPTGQRQMTARDAAGFARMEGIQTAYNRAATRISQMPAGAARDRAIEEAESARQTALQGLIDLNPADNALANLYPQPSPGE